MQYRRISADCHLDLPWLPPELFVENATREFKNRMPYVEEGPEGPKWTTKKKGWSRRISRTVRRLSSDSACRTMSMPLMCGVPIQFWTS